MNEYGNPYQDGPINQDLPDQTMFLKGDHPQSEELQSGIPEETGNFYNDIQSSDHFEAPQTYHSYGKQYEVPPTTQPNILENLVQTTVELEGIPVSRNSSPLIRQENIVPVSRNGSPGSNHIPPFSSNDFRSTQQLNIARKISDAENFVPNSLDSNCEPQESAKEYQDVLFMEGEYGSVDSSQGLLKVVSIESQMSTAYYWEIHDLSECSDSKLVSMTFGPRDWGWQAMYLSDGF